MISLGKNITQAGDVLQQISMEQLFRLISKPSDTLFEQIEQLRLVLNIDPNRYRLLKKELPYFVCAKFHPKVRQSANFVSIAYFVLDIDHISQKQMDINILRNRMRQDKRLMLMFESPSADGLKLVFRLAEPIYDLVRYKLFYKSFCQKFSQEYQLNQVIDMRTNDATRATFLSVDPLAYFNEKCLPIDAQESIDFENALDIMAVEHAIKLEAAEAKAVGEDESERRQILSSEILLELRKKLNPRVKAREEVKTWFVPQQVDKLVESLRKRVEGSSLTIKSVDAIHYGRKIVFESGFIWAELNIFYGKKGFSVVKTPKKGSDVGLADLCYDLMYSVIKGYE
ncbi:MAG: hypothetical protein JXR34_09765 [Bacteroidales bacterium]|nr:hypothetical protein [Bacteroidales bacterium]